MNAMLCREQAEEKVREHMGEDFEIIDSFTEKVQGVGWCFIPRKKKDVSSGIPDKLPEGGGGILVNRENGEIFTFGACYPPEYWFEAYKKGIGNRCNLVIKSVRNVNKALKLLASLTLCYVIEEESHGEVWKIPKRYSAGQMWQRLQSMPVVFENQNLSLCLYELQKIESSKVMDIEIVKVK